MSAWDEHVEAGRAMNSDALEYEVPSVDIERAVLPDGAVVWRGQECRVERMPIDLERPFARGFRVLPMPLRWEGDDA